MGSTQHLQHAPVVDVAEPPAADLAPVDLPRSPLERLPFAPLKQQIAQATQAARFSPDEEREAEAEVLVGRLRELLACAEPGAAADYLCAQLEERTWEGLVAPDGWTARAAAVEALIGLGFPHAFKVTPEDLEHLRETQARGPARKSKKPRRLGILSRGGLAALATGTLVELLVAAWSGGVPGLPSLMLMSCAWVGAWLMVRDSGRARGGGLLLAIAAATGLTAPVWAAGPGVGLVGGATAALAAVLLGLGRRNDS